MSSSGLKLPNNARNVRQSLAEEGFYFDEEGSYDKYPELQKVVNKIFNHERYSAVRHDSAEAFKYRGKENAMAPEDSYFVDALPHIFKKSRSVLTAGGEVII